MQPKKKKNKPYDPLGWKSPSIITEETPWLDIEHDMVANWKGRTKLRGFRIDRRQNETESEGRAEDINL